MTTPEHNEYMELVKRIHELSKARGIPFALLSVHANEDALQAVLCYSTLSDQAKATVLASGLFGHVIALVLSIAETYGDHVKNEDLTRIKSEVADLCRAIEEGRPHG